MKERLADEVGKKHPTFVFDRNTLKIVYINKKAIRLYGYNDDEFIGMSMLDLRPEEDQEIFRKTLERNDYSAPDRLVRRHKKKNGGIFLAQIKAYKLKKSDLICAEIQPLNSVSETKKESRKVSTLIDQHLENSMLGIIIWDHNLRVVRWSPRTEEISGYASEEVIGQSLFMQDIIRPEDQFDFKKRLFRLLGGEQNQTKIVTSIFTKGKVHKIVRLHFSIIKDDNQKVESLLSFVEDITQQKQVKRDLKFSEEKYRALFEAAPHGVIFLKDEEFTDCNKKITELFECSKEHIIGADPVFFSPEFQPNGERSDVLAEKYIKTAYSDGSVEFDWMHESAKGNKIDATVSLKSIELSDGRYIQAIIKDLTKERETKRKLKRNEHLFRNLFLNSPAAIVMVDKKNRVEQLNESFENLFGYTLEDLEGKELDSVIVPEEDYDDAPKMPAIGKSKEDLTREVIRNDKFGNKKHLLLSGIPVYMDGKPFKGFGMYLDISELKNKEQHLRDSLNEKKVLLEEVHHRVKNNLAVVSSLLQLQSFKIHDQEISNVLNDCQARVQSIGMVHELLYRSDSFAKISFTQYLQELVKNIHEIQHLETQNIDFSVSSPDDMVVNINQAVPLALLLNEIIMNAYKHAFAGMDSGAINVEINKTADKEVAVLIRDNGTGLPDDFNFDSAETLGMTLVKTLATQLKADLEILSEDGVEYRITFEISDRKGSSNLHMN